MLYIDFMNKVSENVIFRDELTGVHYLDPDYRRVMEIYELDPAEVTDTVVDYARVKERLELEVKRMNSLTDSGAVVMSWIADIISTSVEPAMENMDNDLVKNMIEYLQVNANAKKAADAVTKNNSIKNNSVVSFSKKNKEH